MNNEKMPVGTVYKDENNKLHIITGYPDEQYETDYDYIVCPYPFSLTHVDAYQIQKSWKNFDEFARFNSATTISKKDIKEIVFYGYKDENFS